MPIGEKLDGDHKPMSATEAPHYSHARWEALLARSIEQIRKLADQKGGEYAGDNDRLANFRRNGLRMDLPMEVIWGVYANKHWDAITQYIQDLKNGKVRARMEPLAGRADDLIVYALLFKAMLEERDGSTDSLT